MQACAGGPLRIDDAIVHHAIVHLCGVNSDVDVDVGAAPDQAQIRTKIKAKILVFVSPSPPHPFFFSFSFFFGQGVCVFAKLVFSSSSSQNISYVCTCAQR